MEMKDYQLNRQVLNVEKSAAFLGRAILASEMQNQRLDSRVDNWWEERSRAAVAFPHPCARSLLYWFI